VSLYLLFSLSSVFNLTSYGIVNALVDFKAKNLGVYLGTYFALN
jgi:hypothetical protein